MSARLFHELPRIAAALLHEPWMIIPSHHRSLVEQVEAFVENRHGASAVSEHRAASWFDEPELPPGAINRVCTYDKKSRLAVINARGVIGKGLSSLAMNCGGLCLDQVEGALDALRSTSVEAVALHFNTPGGTVNGPPECSAAIRAFSEEVAPVFGYTDTMCCSAGYWLATACDSFHVASSAYIGSIGVYAYLIDTSAEWAASGRRMILAASGEQKAAGFPGVPVTDQQIASLKDGVARCANRFFAQVRTRRANVGNDAFDGDYWQAADAPPGLHDGFINSRGAHLAHAYQNRRVRK